MKKQIISSILIFCMLIQIHLTQVGCTSFYPAGDNDLSKYSEESGLLLRMQDKTDLDISPANSVFIDSSAEFIYAVGKEYNYSTKKLSDFKGVIEKDKIDSAKFFEINSTKYYICWLNDNRKITCEKEMFSTTPDSGSSFWLVYDNNKNEIRKVHDSEIEAVEIQKTNWVATSFLILIGAAALTLLIFSITYEGITFENGGSF